jgi:hypothetical protein
VIGIIVAEGGDMKKKKRRRKRKRTKEGILGRRGVEKWKQSNLRTLAGKCGNGETLFMNKFCILVFNVLTV